MQRTIDVAGADYSDWLKLVFDHPVLENEENWKWDDDIQFVTSRAETLVRHMTHLGNDFAADTELYSPQQINAGLRFLFCYPERMGYHLADENIPLEIRLSCVRSMYTPYAGFVAHFGVEEMQTSFDLWWDFIVSDYCHAIRWKYKGDAIKNAMKNENARAKAKVKAHVLVRIEVPWEELGTDEQQILEAILQTLICILQTLICILDLDDNRCQHYALRGLGHLRHPQKFATVQKFIDTNREDFNDIGINWMEQCRDGTVA